MLRVFSELFMFLLILTMLWKSKCETNVIEDNIADYVIANNIIADNSILVVADYIITADNVIIAGNIIADNITMKVL